ncbi:MAG: hypothetical protein QW275_01800 [Candidatus Anstonellaceae archaeon]
MAVASKTRTTSKTWNIVDEKSKLASGKLTPASRNALLVFYKRLEKVADVELNEKKGGLELRINGEKGKQEIAKGMIEKAKEEIGLDAKEKPSLIQQIKGYFSSKNASPKQLEAMHPARLNFGLWLGEPPKLLQKIAAAVGAVASIATGDYFGPFTSAAHSAIRLPSKAIVFGSAFANAVVGLFLHAASIQQTTLRGLISAAAVGFAVEKIRQARIKKAEEFENATSELKASLDLKGQKAGKK